VLLVSTGLVTTVPLLLFTACTRRLPLSAVGLLQYLAPVLQFAVGVGIRHEPLPTAELIGFARVWLALIMLSVAGLRAGRRARALAGAEQALAAP
jgi:chloramphenicol-sensitive protein RarD